MREGLKCRALLGDTSIKKRNLQFGGYSDRECIYGRLYGDRFNGAEGVFFTIDTEDVRAYVGDQIDLNDMERYDRRRVDLETFLKSQLLQREIKEPEIIVCKKYIPPESLKTFP